MENYYLNNNYYKHLLDKKMIKKMIIINTGVKLISGLKQA